MAAGAEGGVVAGQCHFVLMEFLVFQEMEKLSIRLRRIGVINIRLDRGSCLISQIRKF